MAPLMLREVSIGHTTYQVGIFGCTRSTPLIPDEIIAIPKKISSKQDLTFLLVDANLIAGADHLLFATIHAYTAFNQHTNRASTREMEILRFAAAQRQISQAMSLLGVSKSTRRFAGVLTNSTSTVLEPAYLEFLKIAEASDDATVLELNTSEKAQVIQEAFQIPNEELKAICPSQDSRKRRLALQKLVYDRCALLAISR